MFFQPLLRGGGGGERVGNIKEGLLDKFRGAYLKLDDEVATVGYLQAF